MNMLAPVSLPAWELCPSKADIIAATSASAYRKGEAYVTQGRVLELAISPDGSTVTARTRGGNRNPYKQSIHLRLDHDGRISIEGSCTCFPWRMLQALPPL